MDLVPVGVDTILQLLFPWIETSFEKPHFPFPETVLSTRLGELTTA
jgi:hypothetical protein